MRHLLTAVLTSHPTELKSLGERVQNYSYHVEWSEEDGEYVATSSEFSEASALAATPEQALAELKVALEGVVAVMEEDGVPLPDPAHHTPYSGQFRLRLPKSVHAQLARRADVEGVSLNALAQTYVACGLASDFTTTSSANRLVELMIATQPRAVISPLQEESHVTGRSALALFGAAPLNAAPLNVTKTGELT